MQKSVLVVSPICSCRYIAIGTDEKTVIFISTIIKINELMSCIQVNVCKIYQSIYGNFCNCEKLCMASCRRFLRAYATDFLKILYNNNLIHFIAYLKYMFI